MSGLKKKSTAWPTEPLGDLCDIVIGRTPSRNQPEFWDGEQPWLSIADMNQGRLIEKTKERITSVGVSESRSRLIPKGTVLLSFKLSIGKVSIAGVDLYTNEAIAALPIHDPQKLNRDFLFWCLQSIRLDEEVDVAAKGKTLNSKKLERLPIPLPPLDEQKRIAAILDKADALRRQRQESLQLTETLLQSAFIKMFVANPEATNWSSRSVEWMASNTKGSIRTGPFGSQLLHSEFVDSGIAVLGIDNAVKNRFEWGQPRFITPEKYQGLKRYKVFPGDLIITIMGTLGRCAIVPDDIPEAVNTKHLCCITLDHKKCLPEFLQSAFLYHPSFLRQLGVRTIGALVPGLNMGIIKELELPLPPIELQEKFKHFVARHTKSEKDFEDSQQCMNNLFYSVQQRAFRGELDLSKVKLESSEPAPAETEIKKVETVDGIFHRPGYFPTPPELEAEMMELESQLDRGHPDSIPWNENYFKYRVLSQVLRAPFTFREIWDQVQYDMPDADYETVKDTIFEYVQQGVLEQRFDEDEKGIVFCPPL